MLDLATRAAKQGVATTRFSITREQAQELRRIEAQGGQEAGLVYVLRLLAEQNNADPQEKRWRVFPDKGIMGPK